MALFGAPPEKLADVVVSLVAGAGADVAGGSPDPPG